MIDEKPQATWAARIDACEKFREEFITRGQENVAFRVMQPFTAEGESDRVALPEDWSRTKAKTSDLAFRLPQVSAVSTRPEFDKSRPVATALVNQTLRQIGMAYVVDECLADAINASGLLAAVVSMDIRKEKSEPLTDEAGRPLPAPDGGEQLPPIDRVVWQQASISRLSICDLLWPAEFRISDWRKARWLGYQSDLSEARIRAKWKVPAEWKCGEGEKAKTLADQVRDDLTKTSSTKTSRVSTIFYYAAEYDADKVHPQCIRYKIFVDGIDDPVEEGDADEQIWVPEQPAIPPGPNGEPGSPAVKGHYEGLTRLPIIVETLAYVSDMAVPPSDSTIGRAGVRELMRSRSQMIRQRDFSIPLRWYDTNRVDESIIEAIRAGRWQDLIPMNGPGDRAIGEVARAAYPRETFSFDAVIRQGLDQSWSLSNNQMALPNAETKSATEVNSVDSSASKRSRYERERVNRFVVSCGAVVWSLIQRYGSPSEYVKVVGQDGADAWQEVRDVDLKSDYEFEFVADTTEDLDLATRQANFVKAYNIGRNTANANGPWLDAELWRLHGIDPARAMLPPAPPKEEPANISYRFSGEDLLNPVALALLLKNQEITPKEIEAAALMIKDAVASVQKADPSVIPPKNTLVDVEKGGTPPEVEPPETVEPILKRAADGTHF